MAEAMDSVIEKAIGHRANSRLAPGLKRSIPGSKVWSLRIILATVLSQAALGPVGLSALELAKRILSTVGH